METFGLPMSFGKKVKGVSVNLGAKVEKTRRDDFVGSSGLPFEGCIQIDETLS